MPAQAGLRHPRFARWYPTLSAKTDDRGARDHRARLLAGLACLAGEVIDVGAGTRAGFGHYPAAVTRVLAVEPEPRLRACAAAAARAAHVRVDVTGGVASALPADEASYDAAVVSFVLCTVPDQGMALAEIGRVLRPGGRLCFPEHVRASSSGLARAQRALDATLWPLDRHRRR